MSSREAVLSLLRGEEGFLSGQELSRRLKRSEEHTSELQSQR